MWLSILCGKVYDAKVYDAGIYMSYLQWSKEQENTGKSQAIVKVFCSILVSVQLTIEFTTRNYLKDCQNSKQ